MEISAKIQVYRVDATKKGEWVQCRALATFPDGMVQQLTVLRMVKDALVVGQYHAKFVVREREGNLQLEVQSISAAAPAVSKVA